MLLVSEYFRSTLTDSSYITYSFGAAFTPFYRLVGPFRSDSAPTIIKTELWDTITRRGVLGNLLMGLIPMLFYGWLSFVVYGAETFWNLLGRPVIPIRVSKGSTWTT